MKNIKIIVDSACDIPKELLIGNDIELLPFRIIVDREEYLDGIDINTDKLFTFMKEGRYITTSQVRAVDFEKSFTECAKKDLKCIYLAFSSKMSGAYQTAKLVAEEVKVKYPDFKIEIIDTKCGSTAIGLLVERIINFENENIKFEDLIYKIRQMSSSIEHIFTLENLERLKIGGRISKTAAFVGDLFSIKPILEVKEGKIHLFKKVRGYNKAYNKILDIMDKRGYDLKNQIIGISYTGDIKNALKLQKMIKERFSVNNFMINMISNVLAVHLGRSGVGVFFFNK